MTAVYLGLGSNLGDREGFLRQAVSRLASKPGIKVCRVSSIYETEPVGFKDQGPFLNAVAVIETDMVPEKLLAVCLTIEKELMRQRDVRWGPRTIDIDILLYGDSVLQLPELTVPHPRMKDRLFVLIPLQEVAPDLAWGGRSIKDYIGCAGGSGEVQLYTSW